MTNPIGNIQIQSPAALPGQGIGQTEAAKETTSFCDFLADSIRQVNAMQQDADAAVEQLVTGEEVTPAEVLTAVQKADIAFRLMIQVRNKMVQAFEEIENLRV